MSLTKEQKAALTEELKGFMCSAKFELDGHEIAVAKKLKSENQLVLLVFIDGSIEGKNIGAIDNVELDVAKKVYRHRQIAHYKAKDIKAIEKAWGKREAKKAFPRLHEKLTYLDCAFNTTTSLVRQFSKLEGIKLIELGGKPV